MALGDRRANMKGLEASAAPTDVDNGSVGFEDPLGLQVSGIGLSGCLQFSAGLFAAQFEEDGQALAIDFGDILSIAGGDGFVQIGESDLGQALDFVFGVDAHAPQHVADRELRMRGE